MLRRSLSTVGAQMLVDGLIFNTDGRCVEVDVQVVCKEHVVRFRAARLRSMNCQVLRLQNWPKVRALFLRILSSDRKFVLKGVLVHRFAELGLSRIPDWLLWLLSFLFWRFEESLDVAGQTPQPLESFRGTIKQLMIAFPVGFWRRDIISTLSIWFVFSDRCNINWLIDILVLIVLVKFSWWILLLTTRLVPSLALVIAMYPLSASVSVTYLYLLELVLNLSDLLLQLVPH